MNSNGQRIGFTQRTDDPRSGRIDPMIETAAPIAFSLRVRVPGWAAAPCPAGSTTSGRFPSSGRGSGLLFPLDQLGNVAPHQAVDPRPVTRKIQLAWIIPGYTWW